MSKMKKLKPVVKPIVAPVSVPAKPAPVVAAAVVKAP
jgi:hypothetical protein